MPTTGFVLPGGESLHSVTATGKGALFAGSSYHETTDSEGGKESKGVVVNALRFVSSTFFAGAGAHRSYPQGLGVTVALLRERGRGILIIEHYMDRTQFSLANNRLCMIRRRQTEPDPGAIPPSELPQVEPRSSEAAVEKLPFTAVDVERQEPKPVLIPESIELAPAISPAGDSQDAVSAGGMSSPILVEKRHDLQIASICESRITEDNARTIEDCLSEAAEQTVHLVVDMSAVEFMSSIGIGAIVAIYKQIKRKKGQFVLSGVRPAVHSILKITGLLELIQTAPDQSKAIQLIRRKE